MARYFVYYSYILGDLTHDTSMSITSFQFQKELNSTSPKVVYVNWRGSGGGKEGKGKGSYPPVALYVFGYPLSVSL